MNKTLLVIRIVFIALCAIGSWLLCYTVQEWDNHRGLAVAIGLMIGTLVVLVDLMLKGFSLRGMTALTFGLAIGAAYAVGGAGLLVAAAESGGLLGGLFTLLPGVALAAVAGAAAGGAAQNGIAKLFTHK